MKKLITILFLIAAIYSNGQTISNAKPQDGYYKFNDSTWLTKPLLSTAFSATSTLHFLMGDSTNKRVYNYLSPSAFVTSLGNSFIANGTSQQTSASFNIDGNGTINTDLRVNGRIGVNAAPTGSNGIYMIGKNFYEEGSVSDASAIIFDVRANNSGQRMALRGDGLLFLGYSTAPTQQSATNLYLNRMFVGNDDAGYIQMSRYNSGTPYAIIQTTQSASTAGNSGFQFISSDAGTQRIGIQIEATGTLKFPQYSTGTLTSDASGNITSVSDVRLKDIQGNYSGGLKEIMNITPIIYKWNEKSGLERNHNYIGFSAQNIQQTLGSDAVGVNKDGYLSLQDRAIMAAMINAIKEQQKEIEELKAIIKNRK